MPKLRKLNIVICVQKDRTLAVATQASILHECGWVKGARGGSAIYIILCDFPGGGLWGVGRVYSTIAQLSLPRDWTCTFLRFDCSRKSFNNILGSQDTALAKSFHAPAQARPFRATPLVTVIYNSDCASLVLHRLAR